VSGAAVYAHVGECAAQVQQCVGLYDDDRDVYWEVQGEGEFSHAAFGSQQTWGCEEGAEGDDYGAQKSDALVPMGVDWGQSVYDCQRPEAGEGRVAGHGVFGWRMGFGGYTEMG